MTQTTNSYVSTTERVAGIGNSSQEMGKDKNVLSPKKAHCGAPS